MLWPDLRNPRPWKHERRSGERRTLFQSRRIGLEIIFDIHKSMILNGMHPLLLREVMVLIARTFHQLRDHGEQERSIWGVIYRQKMSTQSCQLQFYCTITLTMYNLFFFPQEKQEQLDLRKIGTELNLQ